MGAWGLFFETGFNYAVLASLKLTVILLPQLFKYWDNKLHGNFTLLSL